MLHKTISSLQAQQQTGALTADEIVEVLDIFFKGSRNFKYTRDCAQNYAYCETVEDRCNQFIAGKRGVFFEYAHTFARILEQSFQIPARLVGGRVITDQKISAETHQ